MLDADGNALGGLRLPQLLAPDATYGIGTSGRCWLYGYQVPFAAQRMHRLYGTRAAYASAVRRAALADVRRRFISAAAGRRIVAAARAHSAF